MFAAIVKVLIKHFYNFKEAPIRLLWRKYNSDSKNVVLVFPNFPKRFVQYLYSDSFVSDLSLLSAVASQTEDYRFVLGMEKAKKEVKESRLFYITSNRFNVDSRSNYNSSILEFIDKMSENEVVCYPGTNDVIWWENKAFMHEKFEELSMKTPESVVVDLNGQLDTASLTFPLLVKEIHSAGARGIYKVNSESELQELLGEKGIRDRGDYVIVQRLLEIDRDLRVALIDDYIFYSHWRFNDSMADWEPTTYKKGKKGDFENFPEEWRAHIITEFQKTGLVTGAFDLTWENNDFTQAPYILEISPSYFPNPHPPQNRDIGYGDYKHRLYFRDSYEKHFVNRSYELRNRLVEKYLENDLSNS